VRLSLRTNITDFLSEDLFIWLKENSVFVFLGEISVNQRILCSEIIDFFAGIYFSSFSQIIYHPKFSPDFILACHMSSSIS